MRCEDCGKQVHPHGGGFYREVTGWEKVRGAMGGANQIVLRKETGRLLCGGCGERRKLHARMCVSPEQGCLL